MILEVMARASMLVYVYSRACGGGAFNIPCKIWGPSKVGCMAFWRGAEFLYWNRLFCVWFCLGQYLTNCPLCLQAKQLKFLLRHFQGGSCHKSRMVDEECNYLLSVVHFGSRGTGSH